MIQIKKCLNSFKYAFQGILYSLKYENNIKVHVFAVLLVVLLGVWVELSTLEWCMLVLTMGMVLACELVNTAIEKLTDLVSPTFHVQAGLVKDVAAGAVLVTAITSVVIGLLVFLPHFL